MAEKESRKGKALYSDSPTLKRGEDGALKPSKPSDGKPAKVPEANGEGELIQVRQAHERRELHTRHASEHLAMHSRHEHEHHLNTGVDRAAMHTRHEKEYGEMHKRHEDELKALLARHLGEAGGK